MLAVYESGVGKLGFIYDVMRNELLGWKGIGVYKMMSHCLDQQINPYRKAYLVNSYLSVIINMESEKLRKAAWGHVCTDALVLN